MTDRSRAVDPRAAKTRAALQSAALTLFDAKDIAQITVSDIVATAGVNRSSFYMHYPDLHELFADTLDAVIVQAGEVGGHSDGGDAQRSSADMPPVVAAFITHVAAHADIYRWALGAHGSPTVAHRIRMRFQDSLNQGFAHHLAEVPGADLGFNAQAAFLSGAMVGVLAAWLDTEPLYPPADFAAWLWSEVSTQFVGMVERATGHALTGARS